MDLPACTGQREGEGEGDGIIFRGGVRRKRGLEGELGFAREGSTRLREREADWDEVCGWGDEEVGVY